MGIFDAAVWCYRQITANSRERMMAKLRLYGKVPISVLFYHRVAAKQDNPWTISACDFKRHLDWLQQSFHLVSLSEAQQAIRSTNNHRSLVAITFDDGYADNTDYAIPELYQRGIPVTYFVTTQNITDSRPFPHDIDCGNPLRPNSWDELREYVKLGVEIGAHTRTHCNVAQLESDEQLEFEIAGSIQDVRQHLGTECNYFAFPFGKTTTINRAAVDLLRRLGCKGYCSAYGTFNWPGNFGFHIRRFHGDPSLQRIKNWLTLDKRHLIGNQNEDFEDIQSQLPEQLVTDLSLLPSEPNGR